jgi:hypothetical protein
MKGAASVGSEPAVRSNPKQMGCAMTRRWRPAATSRCSRSPSTRCSHRLPPIAFQATAVRVGQTIATRESRSPPRGRLLSERPASASAPRCAFALPLKQPRGRRPPALAPWTIASVTARIGTRRSLSRARDTWTPSGACRDPASKSRRARVRSTPAITAAAGYEQYARSLASLLLRRAERSS